LLPSIAFEYKENQQSIEMEEEEEEKALDE
jgi:hypothetical protein